MNNIGYNHNKSSPDIDKFTLTLNFTFGFSTCPSIITEKNKN